MRPRRHHNPSVAALTAAALAAWWGTPCVARADAAAPVPPVIAIEDVARELRICGRTVRTGARRDLFGLRPIDIDARCSGLRSALVAGGAALDIPPEQLTPGAVMTLRQIEDLTLLAESVAAPAASMRLLPAARLDNILGSLDPAARGELSTRARIVRWWRSVIGEFEQGERRRQRVGPAAQWPLGFWSAVSWLAFAAAALLVVTVIAQEVRAALGLRDGSRTRPKGPVSALAADLDAAALSMLGPRQRAGELLRLVAGRLHARDALPPPAPLTPREIDRLAQLPTDHRASLAMVTRVGESGAYGRRPPDEAALASAVEAAAPWLGRPSRRWARVGLLRGAAAQGGAR